MKRSWQGGPGAGIPGTRSHARGGSNGAQACARGRPPSAALGTVLSSAGLDGGTPYRCLLYIKRGHAITFLGKRLLSGCLQPRSGSSGQARGGGRAKQLLPAGQRHRLPPSCCRPPGLPVLTRVQGSGPQADLLLSGQKCCLAELQLITCLRTALSR